MKHLKLSVVILLIVMYAATAFIFYLLCPYYGDGFCWGDFGLCLWVETVAFVSMTGILNKEKYTVQSIAYVRQLMAYAGILGTLVLCHVVSSVFMAFDWNVIYYILSAVLTVYYAVRLFFVHTGATIQAKTDIRIETYMQERQQNTARLEIPSSRLIGLVNGMDAKYKTKADAADAVQAVMDSFNALPLKAFQRNPLLAVEAGKWQKSLESWAEENYCLMDRADVERNLENIRLQANSMNQTIKSLK